MSALGHLADICPLAARRDLWRSPPQLLVLRAMLMGTAHFHLLH